MFNNIATASAIYIDVDGVALSQAELSGLVEAVVDQHAHLPNMFTLQFFDPEMKMLDGYNLSPSQTIEIKSVTTSGRMVSLIRGEITSVEPLFEQDGLHMIVRGYDPAFRMYHTVRSRTFVNIKDSDLAEKIAKDWNLKTEIEPTKIVYDHLFQHNQNDLAFLLQRAWRIGYECFVRNETLYFRKPQANAQPVQTLKFGSDLLAFRPRMSSAEQVNEVIVRGWNQADQKPIIGRAQTGKLFANTQKTPSSHKEEIDFGEGKLIIVDHPVTSQSEADLFAQARMDELSGSFVSAEGIAFRRPEVTAGDTVLLEGLGNQFNGQYLITAARHVFSDSEGFETSFTINGTRSGLLIDELVSFEKVERWFGTVTAIVTNNNDPKQLGRVKLKYPWLDTRIESDWVMVNAAGASSNSGFFSPPSVDDQVLVTFAHGDFNSPIVLGMLPKEKYSFDGNVSTQGQTTLNRWSSRQGHKIELRDAGEKQGLLIETKAGHTIAIDEEKQQLTIKSQAGCEIVIDDQTKKISITSLGDLDLKAEGKLSLASTGDLDLTASGNVKIKGSRIDLN